MRVDYYRFYKKNRLYHHFIQYKQLHIDMDSQNESEVGNDMLLVSDYVYTSDISQ